MLQELRAGPATCGPPWARPRGPAEWRKSPAEMPDPAYSRREGRGRTGQGKQESGLQVLPDAKQTRPFRPQGQTAGHPQNKGRDPSRAAQPSPLHPAVEGNPEVTPAALGSRCLRGSRAVCAARPGPKRLRSLTAAPASFPRSRAPPSPGAGLGSPLGGPARPASRGAVASVPREPRPPPRATSRGRTAWGPRHDSRPPSPPLPPGLLPPQGAASRMDISGVARTQLLPCSAGSSHCPAQVGSPWPGASSWFGGKQEDYVVYNCYPNPKPKLLV